MSGRSPVSYSKGGHHKTFPNPAPRDRRQAASPNAQKQSLPPAYHEVNTKRSFKKIIGHEISFIMLLLAAQTLSDLGLMNNFLSTELMSDAFRFTGRPSHDDDRFSSSYSSYYSDEKCYTYSSELSEGVSSSNSNTEGTKSGEDEDEEEEETHRNAALHYVSTRSSATQRAFNRNDKVWYNIMGFLSFEENLNIRAVSKFHFRQSLNFAAVMRMPNTGAPAVFIPCRVDLEKNEQVVEDSLSTPKPDSWTCLQCGLYNRDSTATTCAEMYCQAPRPASQCRLFLGQLRRDATVPMVKWLMEEVVQANPQDLIMVENHRNAHTRRGKGCAWPTVRTDTGSADRLLSLHHRLFFDALNGVEGVWWVPNNAESINALEKEANARAAGASHPKHMPRGTIVVELPAHYKHTREPSVSTPQAAQPPPYYPATAEYQAEAYDAYPAAYPYPCDDYAVVFEGPTMWRHNPYAAVMLME
ncbi:hypothetical protein ADEAN_000595300 [Angomonas deanei]|uniref:Uncharacterized protein n=1 Tax=Angomonas deanei TaxID=59799 RepID=A0A7G2CHR5_9TRYP|nr:hypothetical protein ADEAN_000595300 [Angomonas deanei]